MCGIAGFINFKEQIELAQKITCVQNHRGPDAQDFWCEDGILLSHQRLSIIDLDSRADQPFVKSGLVIIFNGEIYNYKELKEQLLIADPGLSFITTSDTEVLLELYRQKKEKCLDDLIGMFAFAIYEIGSGKIFIARDHFGIKPIYYTKIGNSFAFSSELKLLIQVPGFSKKINRKSLLAAVNYLWVPGNDSMFENCFKVPPGHYMIVSNVSNEIKFEVHKFWELETDLKFKDEEDAIRAVKEGVYNSIKRHMTADVPVSSFLSGGLDSSLISVIAKDFNSSLSTYTIATDSKDKKIEKMPEDEKYARQLASAFEFDHNEIKISANIIDDLPKIVYSLDEPIGDPAAINTYIICKAAREKGVKVLLSGMGADEIFFGYRRQQATMKSMWYRRLPSVLRKALGFLIDRTPVRILGKSVKLSRWAKRFNSFANLPLEEAYMKSYSYYDKEELAKLFKQTIDIEYEQLRNEHHELFHAKYPNDPINQICFTDIHMFMQGLNLAYSDKSSMAASVEVRVPFIDKQLIQLGMQIPGNLKFKKGIPKYILKKAAEDYLPHNIIYRPKASFGAPIRSWISNDLSALVDDLLSKENVEKRGLFNYDYIQKLISDDRKGLRDNAYRIYQLLTIELWYRRFAS